jgi:hypothetical protein
LSASVTIPTIPYAIFSTIDVGREIQTLAWRDDYLIDWGAGGCRFYLDGQIVERRVVYDSRFDGVVTLPGSEYVVIYEKLGTKALLLRDGNIVREIDRSYYHSDAYEYPIVLFKRNGRNLIAHCPENYCQLDIEDLDTGKRLTTHRDREPGDFFHSRLSTSQSGKYLMSAGWLWHPLDSVAVHDVDEALRNPRVLDGGGQDLDLWNGEGICVTFTTDERLVVAFTASEIDDADSSTEGIDRPSLSLFDLRTGEKLSSVRTETTVGTMMMVGESYVLGLYEHPKLFDLATGKVVRAWPEINSGNQSGCILVNNVVPALALDPVRMRCAIGDEKKIHVLDFSRFVEPTVNASHRFGRG